ncbi:MAG TPA: radical SAM protein [Candidatus Pacearchaeota archaeon]|nr:radical SAM protein [Candidatus Pacearchaeota archaeon]
MKVTEKKYFGLGNVPIGIGSIIKGWDISEEAYRDPAKLPIVDFRAMTGACPHDCFHCFTDKDRKTLSLEEIKGVIDQLAERGTHAIDFLGEGEPTIDRDFFDIIEYTSKRGIQPVIFTDAATKMRDRGFVERVYDSGASVCPKCDSLFDAEYQNWVVGDKTGKYFAQRNEAIDLLIEQGFNEVQEDGTTRLGFDMVISKRNIGEVERTLRHCRANNLWIVLASYLPSGRSGGENFDRSLVPSEDEIEEMRSVVKQVDGEYNFNHPIWNNFATRPCVEFMQIYGDGRVSPCPGNETVVGNVKADTIGELEKSILAKFPCHDRSVFDGHCLYREQCVGS